MIKHVCLLGAVGLLGLSSLVSANGVTPIVGNNQNNEIFYIEFDSKPYRFERETPSTTGGRSIVTASENIACEFKSKGANAREFHCAADAPAPLAGTRYRAERVKGKCEDEDDEFRYVCVDGCEQQPDAPREMFQGYWDCE